MKRAPIIKNKEDLENFRKSIRADQSPEALRQRISPRSTHWYIYGITPEGKKMFLGPEDTEAEVIRIGDEQSLTGFQGEEPYVFEYDTRDLARATRQAKADLIKQGKHADTVLRRVKH